MSNVVQMVDQAVVTTGDDEGKDREYVEMAYKDRHLREYLPIGWEHLPDQAKRDAMKMTSHRLKIRLELVKKQIKKLKLVKKLKKDAKK